MGQEATKLRKPRGYWKDEANVERELRSLIDTLGRFPTGTDVRNSINPGLNDAITKYGGITLWRERLGFVAAHKPSGYWNDPANVESALTAWIDEHGSFPTYDQLTDAGHGGLIEAFGRHGGLSVWRNRFGAAATEKPKGYWRDAANVERELKAWVAEHGNFPTSTELKERGHSALLSALSFHGGIGAWREKFGVALLRNRPGYWDDPANVERTLQSWIAEHGGFPRRTELSESGLSALGDAMALHGGVATWRVRLGFDSRKMPGYWRDAANVERGLKAWIAQHGRFPCQRELGESGRFDLNVAIGKQGGYAYWRAKLGYGPITPECLREHADVLARVVMALDVADTASFWRALQSCWTMHELAEAIREFEQEGKIEQFRELLIAAD